MRKGWLITSDASKHKRKSKHIAQAPLEWKHRIKHKRERETFSIQQLNSEK